MKKILYLFCCALSVSVLCCTSIVHGQVISTVAGGGGAFGSPYGDGAAATAATLSAPYGLAYDALGNLFICDEMHGRIRRVDHTTGNITTVAGITLMGPPPAAPYGDGGQATAAYLNTPTGVAVDAAGNLYICDAGNSVVRMVNAGTGIISTIAGTPGSAGFSGDLGPATAAKMSNPRGIAVYPNGNLIYVSDGNNNRIRAIAQIAGNYFIGSIAGNTAGGFGGDGSPATAAAVEMKDPRGVAIDFTNGNIYIADMTNSRIRMIDSTTRIISTVAGTTGGGGFTADGVAATTSKLNVPTGVAVTSGNIYIADVGNNRIRYVTAATGLISTIVDNTGATGAAPYGDGGAAAMANLNAPTAVTLAGATGNYYISDQGHNRVRFVNVSVVTNTPPSFVHAGAQALTVCENSSPNSINSLLEITDPDMGQTETWTQITPPAHGTLVYAYSATSTGSTITPTGLTYTPAPGYSGTDVFKIGVNDGTATATTTVNVTVSPLPTIAAIGGPTAVCAGSSIVLTETTTGGFWSAANTAASIVGGTVTGNVAGADNIYYSATNACGTDSATVVVDVNASAAPSVTVSSSLGTTTCSVPGTFTANPINGGSSPAYQWSVNSVLVSGATSVAYTYTPVAGDVVSVQMTSNAPCVTTATATGSITMSGGSSVLPTIIIASGITNDTFCVGVPVTFSSSITNGGTSPSYIWTVGGTALGFGSTFTYSPAVASAGAIVEATLTSSIPCAVPSTVTSNDIIIHLRLATSSSLAIAAHPGNTVCAGTNVTFTSAETGGGSAPSYRWTKAGVNVATGPSYTTIPGDSDQVYCTMHSSIACSPTDSVLSNVITMTMEPVITPVVTITSAALLTSVGDSVKFSATITSTTVSPSYQWYLNGVPVPGATSGTYTLKGTAAENAVVNCAVTSGDACSAVGLSNFISVTVAAAGVTQVNSSSAEMKLVPNPNKGIFTLTLTSSNDEPVSVVITNILGEKVKELTTATNTALDIKIDDAPGIYLLSATTAQGSRYVAKVMVN